jgi:hypothetical protein
MSSKRAPNKFCTPARLFLRSYINQLLLPRALVLRRDRTEREVLTAARVVNGDVAVIVDLTVADADVAAAKTAMPADRATEDHQLSVLSRNRLFVTATVTPTVERGWKSL